MRRYLWNALVFLDLAALPDPYTIDWVSLPTPAPSLPDPT